MGNELEECLEVPTDHTGLEMTLERQLQVDACVKTNLAS
jgi:hypothetical protein